MLPCFTEHRVSPSLPPLQRWQILLMSVATGIAVASNYYAQPLLHTIADAFGVPHLLAVRLQRDAQGRATGRIDGVPSFREGKITRVEQWLSDQGRHLGQFDRVSFYSDSPNDLPLLERSTDPVATNPSPELEAVAQSRGWRILRLFA